MLTMWEKQTGKCCDQCGSEHFRFPSIRFMFGALMNYSLVLSDKELELILSLEESYETKNYLTTRQRDLLRNIYATAAGERHAS